MNVVFISDLHLHGDRPEAIEAFKGFLRDLPERASALYILGDLFEFWIGDDAPLPAYLDVLEALRRAGAAGLPMYFMHGNRDFLIGARFEQATGCRILPDPTVIEIGDEPVLLMHGDTLCTGDTDYQQFRRQVRDPQWQQVFLGQPLEKRIEIAKFYRGESIKRTSEKAMEIMDVAQPAVEEAMAGHQVRYLVHGHTHRPAIHDFNLQGRPAQRIVLGDWYDQGSMLEWTDSGFELKTLALT